MESVFGQQATEQRQHSRQLSRINVVFLPEDSKPRQAIAENISLGGAWLNLPQDQPEVGAEGKLHACIEALNLYMMAKVVRRNESGIAVTFIDMSMDTYQNLKQLMQRISKRSGEGERE